MIGHNARTSSEFTLNDLCGGAGRLDVLLRCVNSAFFLSHDLRRDVELYLVLLGPPEPPKCIRMVGKELKHLNPDERSTGAIVRKALSRELGAEEKRTMPGVYISTRSFSQLLDDISPYPVLWLHEEGEDIREVRIPPDPVFVLSDHLDFTEEEEEILQSRSTMKLSLGPLSLHAHHCITIVQNELDRANQSR